MRLKELPVRVRVRARLVHPERGIGTVTKYDPLNSSVVYFDLDSGEQGGFSMDMVKFRQASEAGN